VRRPAVARLVVLLTVGALVPACSNALGDVPRCDSERRLALVAQAAPAAAYLPCVDHLEEGWQDSGFEAGGGEVTFRLDADRADGPVGVALEEACDVADAVPTTPRAEGVRTSIRLTSVSPRYAGALVDVFPGGCVTYRFDFPRGAHIPLMEELQATVGLVSRQELRVALRRELSVELVP
jgi:hypothetical protein